MGLLLPFPSRCSSPTCSTGAWQRGREGVSAARGSPCVPCRVPGCCAQAAGLELGGCGVPGKANALCSSRCLNGRVRGSHVAPRASILLPPFLPKCNLSFPSPLPLLYNCFLGLFFMLR